MFSSNSSQVSDAANYIEDVFSCFLYTGTSATQTITNSVDLSTKGGLVWLKWRSGTNAFGNALYDTVRGPTEQLVSETTGAQTTQNRISSFNSNGFTLTSNTETNYLNDLYVSWTFREQSKFFDIVTYTGTGVNRTVAHNLNSVPGCIIVKRTDTAADWAVYHRSLTNTQYLVLNTAAAAATGATWWNSTTPTSAVFSLGTDASVNASGGTYVAYIFAHDAGGFGLAGTDNVISCGTFSTDATGNSPNINIGYEPQWLMVKCATSNDTVGWGMFDTMRGWTVQSSTRLLANTAAAEGGGGLNAVIKTDGFQISTPVISETYIYIAIRRGPMKVPTVGTSVFIPLSRAGTATTTSVTSIGFPPDLLLVKERNVARPPVWWDKLRGPNRYIDSSTTAAEAAAGSSNGVSTLDQSGATYNPDTGLAWVNDNFYSDIYINYFFLRAPGFFDEVCYTGTGTSNSQSHNLTVAPELVLIKRRDTAANWVTLYDFSASTYSYFLPGVNGSGSSITSSGYGSGEFVGSQPTTTQLPITSAASQTNASGGTYVAYLFATLAGVSKVGSYTGNGTTQTIDCGFTAGARFVLIKRTDSTGDWYVYDTARGMTVLTDPYLLINSTAAEVATLGSVTTVSTGFALDSAILAAINVSAGTYIFLAIA